MKKKAYIIPEATVFSIELQQIIAFSNDGEEGQETKVDDVPDDGDDDNRSRLHHNCWEYDCWEDDA